MNTYIATFYTHYGALKFDKACKDLSVDSKLMPVPRKLSSSCGTCVRFYVKNDSCLIKDIDNQEDLEGCYIQNEEGGICTYIKISTID